MLYRLFLFPKVSAALKVKKMPMLTGKSLSAFRLLNVLNCHPFAKHTRKKSAKLLPMMQRLWNLQPEKKYFWSRERKRISKLQHTLILIIVNLWWKFIKEVTFTPDPKGTYYLSLQENILCQR